MIDVIPSDKKPLIWKESYMFWAALIGFAVITGFIFFDGIERMVLRWSNSEEYGYGFLIPVITAFLIWQKKDELERMQFDGSWNGFLIVLIGIAVYFLGYFSTLFIIIQYGLVIVIFGLAYALVGWEVLKKIWVPLLFLLFMIPLPNFLFKGLSAELQLISSELGVAVIRLFGISVYLEGNVIDLGTYKLQVVEACNGLRYLFPLVTLAFITVYFYKVEFWKRAVVFLSSIPITVIMNSFRIGVIGVLVEYGGPEQAEGFLHDFEGWVVFMACIGILVIEMWLLAKIGKEKRPLSEVFGLEYPDPSPKDSHVNYRAISLPFIVSGALLFITAFGASMLNEREEMVQQRKDFVEFPLSFGEWQGRRGSLEQIYLDALKLDDYVINDYLNETGDPVNFYVAYYADQRSGASAHSPSSCIPGGGWLIADHKQITVNDVLVQGKSLQVNRLVIKKGEFAQVVYYWFQQRGRIITNEYLVKLYLFWDAMLDNRTDGALIRLTSMSKPGEDLAKVDSRIQALLKEVNPLLDEYIPE